MGLSGTTIFYFLWTITLVPLQVQYMGLEAGRIQVVWWNVFDPWDIYTYGVFSLMRYAVMEYITKPVPHNYLCTYGNRWRLLRKYKIRTKPDFLIYRANPRWDPSFPISNLNWRKHLHPNEDDRIPISFQNFTITHLIRQRCLQRDRSLQHPYYCKHPKMRLPKFQFRAQSPI